jgi:hypothetical protein
VRPVLFELACLPVYVVHGHILTSGSVMGETKHDRPM